MDLQKVYTNIPDYLRINEVLCAQFCANLEKLETLLPDLYERFYLYKPTKPFYFFMEEDGSYNIAFIEGNKRLYPVGPMSYTTANIQRYLEVSRPETYNYYVQKDYFGAFHYKYSNECALIMESSGRERLNLIDCPHMPVCTMYGCGLGYHIGELFSRVDIANLLLVETEPDLFYASLFTFNWSSFLDFLKDNKCGFKIIIDTDIDNIVKDYCDFFIRYGRFLSFYYLPFSFQSSPLHGKIHAAVNHKLKYEMTGLSFIDDHLFGSSHAITNLLNKRTLLSREISMPDATKKMPVFVVANGPSLTHDIDFIRKNQDKAFIIACGTALDTLYNMGVKPDFYAATERTNDVATTVEIFNKDGFLDDIVLLSAEVIHPYTASIFKRHIIFNKANETVLWLFLQDRKYIDFVKRWQGAIFMNPLVANMGVSAALSLGFENLYLFGVDNGKVIDESDSSDAIHPDASIVYKANLGDKQGLKFNSASTLDLEGQGSFGGKVKTAYNYLSCARFIGEAIKSFRKDGADVEVVNCSDGLVIKNTRAVRSSSLDFSPLPQLDKKDLVARILEQTFIFDIDKEEVKSLFKQDVYNEIVDEICALLRKDVQSHSELVVRMQDICIYVNKMHQTCDHYYASLIDGSIESFFVMAMNSLYTVRGDKKALEIAGQIIMRLIYLLEDSKILFSMLPDYIQSEHLKRLDNTIGFAHENSEPLKDFKEWYLFDSSQTEYLKEQVKPFVKITG